MRPRPSLYPFLTSTDQSWIMASVGHCPTESSVITDLEECEMAGRFLGLKSPAVPEPPFLASDASPKGCSFSRRDFILWFNHESSQHNEYFASNSITSRNDKYPTIKAVKSSTGRIYFNGSRSTSNISNAKVMKISNFNVKSSSASSASYPKRSSASSASYPKRSSASSTFDTKSSSGFSTYINRVSICRKGLAVVYFLQF